MTSLADLGAVSPGPGGGSRFWTATFMGGQNAPTVYFEEQPEDRAVEELMVRFGADTVAVTPPTVAPADPVDAILADPDVQLLDVSREQAAAVLAAANR